MASSMSFLQQKSLILCHDDLVRICVDFYSVEEIEVSRKLLSKYATSSNMNKRVNKPQGPDIKEVASRTVKLLLKFCLDPSIPIPAFCAINSARLPPVGVEHVDISAILQELISLRHEVRSVKELRAEMANMHSTLTSLAVQQQQFQTAHNQPSAQLSIHCTRVYCTSVCIRLLHIRHRCQMRLSSLHYL
jgi:hypothetical protein